MGAFAVVVVVVLGLVVVAAGALLAFTRYRAVLLLRPMRRAPRLTPDEAGLPLERVRFAGPRGMLVGWYLPATNGCTLICCHGINDECSQWFGPVARLRERGYGALLFDFPGHGQSEGNQVTYGARERLDVAAAVEYLRGRGDVRMDGLAVMGLSLGAITAVLAAADLPDLGAVVIESGFADVYADVRTLFSRFTGLPAFPFANLIIAWGQMLSGVRLADIRPARVIGDIAPRPVLIISDLRDALADEPHDGEELYRNAGDPKQLWQVPEAEHVAAFALVPDEWTERVGTFLDQHLAARRPPLPSEERTK